MPLKSRYVRTYRRFININHKVENSHAELTVMEDGEHWFHTGEQMRFLDDWIRRGEKIASI